MINESNLQVTCYKLDNPRKTFQYEIEGDYVKANLIEQSQTDQKQMYAVAYWDSGYFFVMFIRHDGSQQHTISVNELCGIDSDSKAIEGFWEPLVTVAFLKQDETLKTPKEAFIQAYHRH